MQLSFVKQSLYLHQSDAVEVAFFDAKGASILWVQISGKLANGSAAKSDCDYIRQQLALAFMQFYPIAIMIDFRELEYQFGDGIIQALSPLSEVDLFRGEGFKVAYLISDKNRYGLSSILCFNAESPTAPFFDEMEQAFDYLIEMYDKI